MHSNRLMGPSFDCDILSSSAPKASLILLNQACMPVRRLISMNSEPQSPFIPIFLPPLIVLIREFSSQETFDNYRG